MELRARDVMQTHVVSVSPGLSLPELEQRFLHDHVSGYPVVDGEHLAGVVSRSDVIRRLCVERSVAGYTSDFYHFASAYFDAPEGAIDGTAERLGQRMEGLHVRDVMVRHLITVRPEHTLHHVARALVDNGIHRVLVTEDHRLLGIVSSTDVVRLVADGKLK